MKKLLDYLKINMKKYNLLKPFFKISTTKYNIAINNKEFLSNSVLMWDIENISIKQFNLFEKYIEFTPEHVYIFSKREIGRKEERFFKKKYFNFYHAPTIADDKIIKILRLKIINNSSFIIISSDSHFAPIIKDLIEQDKKVYSISNHINNRRLRMSLPLTNKNLKICSYSTLKSKNRYTISSNVNKKKTVLLKEQYSCDVCSLQSDTTRKENIYYDEILRLWMKKMICDECLKLFITSFYKNTLSDYKLFKKKYNRDIKQVGYWVLLHKGSRYYHEDTEDVSIAEHIEDDSFSNNIDFSSILKKKIR